MADSNETRYYHIVIYNDDMYTTNFNVSNDYRYCLIQDSSNNCLKLVQYYEGSGPEYGTVYYNFNYTNGYNIELGSVNFNESYPSDGTFSSYYSSSNYNDINTMLSPQLNQDIGINFIDIVDDPGDDSGDDPGDDPGDENTYYIAFFTEGSYNNFDNNDYTFSLQPGEDNQLQVLRSDGQYVYTFDYSDGYHIDYYFSDDFDTADPPASSWQFVTGYTNYNDVNNGAMASLGSGNIKLDFYDVVNDPDDDHQFDELSIYQSGTYQDTYETSCGEHEFYFVDDNQGHLKLYNHYYEDEGSDNDTLEYTFNYNNASYLIKYYRSDSYITDYTDINDVNTILRTTDYNTKLDLYVTATPSEGSSTKIGGSSIRLKKIGNATVVKEVLNGVVIYTAE